ARRGGERHGPGGRGVGVPGPARGHGDHAAQRWVPGPAVGFRAGVRHQHGPRRTRGRAGQRAGRRTRRAARRGTGMVEGAVRAPARRRFLLLLGRAGAVALVIAASPVLVRGELPDPLAVGWNSSGYPSKSAGLGEYVLLSLLKWAVVAGVWAVFAHRWPWGPALPGAALGGFGVLLAGEVVQTVLANV